MQEPLWRSDPGRLGLASRRVIERLRRFAAGAPVDPPPVVTDPRVAVRNLRELREVGILSRAEYEQLAAAQQSRVHERRAVERRTAQRRRRDEGWIGHADAERRSGEERRQSSRRIDASG